jgi:hypothetical protein
VLAQEHAAHKADVEQVKGLVCQVEWPGDIHHAEGRVGQPLGAGPRVGVPDHRVTQVEACDLDVGEGEGDIEDPASGPTGQIQHLVQACDLLGQKATERTSHRSCRQSILVDQASQLGWAFRIKDIGISIYCFVGRHVLPFLSLSPESAQHTSRC